MDVELAERVRDGLPVLSRIVVSDRVKVNSVESTGELCQKRGKPDDEPFLDIERLKKNLLHQLERVAKRLENLNPGFGPVHVSDCVSEKLIRKAGNKESHRARELC